MESPNSSQPANDSNNRAMIIGVVQSLGIWAVAALLLIQVFTQFATNRRLSALEERVHTDLVSLETSIDSVGIRVGAIGESDILKLDAVMMRGSETWTLPVSSISWSGR